MSNGVTHVAIRTLHGAFMIFRNIWLGHTIDDSPNGVDLAGLATIGADVVPANKPGYYHIILPNNWRIRHFISRQHLVRHRSGVIREYDYPENEKEKPFIAEAHRRSGWQYHSTVRRLLPYALEYDACGRRRRSLSYHSYFLHCKWWDCWARDRREPYSPDVDPRVVGGATRPQVRLRIQESRLFLSGKMNLDPSQGLTGVWVTKEACSWSEAVNP